MHDVLPPYRTVLAPGLAMEPRVPQNWIRAGWFPDLLPREASLMFGCVPLIRIRSGGTGCHLKSPPFCPVCPLLLSHATNHLLRPLRLLNREPASGLSLTF